MKQRKSLLTAVILSGAVGLGVQLGWSQDAPGTRQPGQTIPDKFEPKSGQPSGQKGLEQQGAARMSTEDIRKLEQALQAKGHNPGPVDGIMDKQTEDALRAFQKANNLAVTGVVDKETAAKLGVQLGGSTPRAGESTPGAREESIPGSKGGSPGSKSGATPGFGPGSEGKSPM